MPPPPPSPACPAQATSALDSHAEAAILRALENVSRGRTVITIAHRLSTMRSCDLVAVLQGGRVAEVGPFAALAADPASAFRRLFAKQLQQLEAGGAGAGALGEEGGAGEAAPALPQQPPPLDPK